VATLTSLVEQIKILTEQIDTQLAAHTDAHIFTSLPRAGTVRAARLLAEIGDCRARFPTPQALACLAGVAPSTRQSGKMRSVGFRWACDKQLRDAVCDFANDSRHANPWAADLYNRARARGHDHPHATRILARAWLYIIWHCWLDQQLLRSRPPPNTPDPAQTAPTNRGLTQGYSEVGNSVYHLDFDEAPFGWE
jgi:transposase